MSEIHVVKGILCTDLPEQYQQLALVDLKEENDCFRVYFNDIIIREIAPYETRRVTCFFEEKQYFELSRDDLETLLKSMKGTETDDET